MAFLIILQHCTFAGYQNSVQAKARIFTVHTVNIITQLNYWHFICCSIVGTILTRQLRIIIFWSTGCCIIFQESDYQESLRCIECNGDTTFLYKTIEVMQILYSQILFIVWERNIYLWAFVIETMHQISIRVWHVRYQNQSCFSKHILTLVLCYMTWAHPLIDTL